MARNVAQGAANGAKRVHQAFGSEYGDTFEGNVINGEGEYILPEPMVDDRECEEMDSIAERYEKMTSPGVLAKDARVAFPLAVERQHRCQPRRSRQRRWRQQRPRARPHPPQPPTSQNSSQTRRRRRSACSRRRPRCPCTRRRARAPARTRSRRPVAPCAPARAGARRWARGSRARSARR